MAINSVNNLEMTDKADASKPPAKRWVYVIPVAVVYVHVGVPRPDQHGNDLAVHQLGYL